MDRKWLQSQIERLENKQESDEGLTSDEMNVLMQYRHELSMLAD